MCDRLVRIGSRLFNLAYVTSIEPDGGEGVDVHIVHGRVVHLDGDEAREARALIDSCPGVPGDLPFEVADDPGEGAEESHPGDRAEEGNPGGQGEGTKFNGSRSAR